MIGALLLVDIIIGHGCVSLPIIACNCLSFLDVAFLFLCCMNFAHCLVSLLIIFLKKKTAYLFYFILKTAQHLFFF